jgi:hypothetical protein
MKRQDDFSKLGYWTVSKDRSTQVRAGIGHK